tara:strand:- start:1804 stop:3234 length:1431 start_codon:yes stop_codon:yes gene_type:complete
MKLLNKNLPFKYDIMVTLINGIVVIGGIFILNGLIARLHGLHVLGEFLLVKRTISSSMGILLIGLNIALPNYLSRNFDKSYADNSYMLFLLATFPLTILSFILVIWSGINGFDQNYFWYYVIFSFGMSSQFMTYAIFRGYMNMIGANIFQLIGTAIIPILVFIYASTIHESLFWIGSISIFVMISSFLFRNEGLRFYTINVDKIKKIFFYGFERVPSFISQFILLAGVPIFIAQKVDFDSVAYFNSSLSLVRLALIIVNPIGLVLLPRISNKVASGSLKEINKKLFILLKAGVFFSIIASIYCYANASIIFKYWLGSESYRGVRILQLTILALPFYTLAGLTRSPIDAISERGYNSIIYTISAIIMILFLYVGKLLDFNFLYTAIFSFVISYIIAAGLSMLVIKKFYKSKLWTYELLRDIILCGFIIYIVNYLLIGISDLFHIFVQTAIYLFLGLLYISIVKTGWMAELRGLFFAK